MKKSGFLVLSLSIFFLHSSPQAGLAASHKDKAPKEDLSHLYKNLEIFTKSLHLIEEDYVEKPDEKKLIEGAIQGMMESLDPHSSYMTPESYKELKVDTEGKFGGVGLEVTLKNGFVTVVTPIEDTPASRAGIRERDRILKIDGIATRDLGLSGAVRKMRGAKGSKIVLQILHEGTKDPVDITLERDIIKIKSVRSELLENEYGYVRITSFQENTSKELQAALEDLKKTSKDDNLKGLILDLRNNPGGLLDEAVRVSNIFLESGVIVTTASRSEEIDRRSATKDGHEPHYPIILIVNGGTASAAEIVAGALQDQNRAPILGTKTFGKGSVQTIYELGNGAALKLTIAKYYTPSGRSIQAEGITPNIIVDPKKLRQKDMQEGIREKDLKGHLKSEKAEKTKSQEIKLTEEEEYEKDVQKRLALEYLKNGGKIHSTPKGPSKKVAKPSGKTEGAESSPHGE